MYRTFVDRILALGYCRYGLARLPEVELEVDAWGASDKLNNLLNRAMPLMKAAILKKVFRQLEVKWVKPHMKQLKLPVFK